MNHYSSNLNTENTNDMRGHNSSSMNTGARGGRNMRRDNVKSFMSPNAANNCGYGGNNNNSRPKPYSRNENDSYNRRGHSAGHYEIDHNNPMPLMSNYSNNNGYNNHNRRLNNNNNNNNYTNDFDNYNINEDEQSFNFVNENNPRNSFNANTGRANGFHNKNNSFQNEDDFKSDNHAIKMRGLPYSATEDDIKEVNINKHATLAHL